MAFPLFRMCHSHRNSHLDIVSLMLEVQIPHFLMDLDDSKRRLFEDSMNGPTPDVPIQDIFALYRRTKTLLGMYKAFCPKYVSPCPVSIVAAT